LDISVFAESEPPRILLCKSVRLDELREILERQEARYSSARIGLVTAYIEPDTALRLFSED
jgi:hypothetical protein